MRRNKLAARKGPTKVHSNKEKAALRLEKKKNGKSAKRRQANRAHLQTNKE